MKYLPFLNGIYSTAPGLIPVAKQEVEEDKLIFQIDDLYNDYLKNKFNFDKILETCID